jgi:hypothetical protein
MTATESLCDPNMRSPTYYVAHTNAECRHCGLATRLLALALPRTHETLEADESADEGDWQHANVDAFLFYVEQLPHRIQHRLQQMAPGFRRAQFGAAQGAYWVNHCEHCGALLDDYELHCEPEGAFMPSSETEATKIHLLRIPEPIEAVAAGYTPDPVFFDCMPAS